MTASAAAAAGDVCAVLATVGSVSTIKFVIWSLKLQPDRSDDVPSFTIALLNQYVESEVERLDSEEERWSRQQ